MLVQILISRIGFFLSCLAGWKFGRTLQYCMRRRLLSCFFVFVSCVSVNLELGKTEVQLHFLVVLWPGWCVVRINFLPELQRSLAVLFDQGLVLVWQDPCILQQHLKGRCMRKLAQCFSVSATKYQPTIQCHSSPTLVILATKFYTILCVWDDRMLMWLCT